ncbi:hypothetical protein C8Q80DRAFT_1109352, partial [Daedaleopsis nitida]
FYIDALLADKHRQEQTLRVPHHGLQSERFNAALAERNARMEGVGQPEWAHACDECEHILVPREGATDQTWKRLSACVMDGVTIGHPHCNKWRCTESLSNLHDRFCPSHSDLQYICAIDNCDNRVTPGFRTCGLPNHRHFETQKRQEGQAFLTLKRRLQKHAAAALRKKKKSTPRVKTSLTRKWTHNDQLLVRPCGVIIGRKAFFDSEGPANALAFLISTFPPHFPNSKPSYIFYDNNCNLLSHIFASGEKHLEGIGMPVHVFHASTKHSDTDDFCQRYCNPAAFPELYDPVTKEWKFNTSICEQTNVWYGKFLPVVREMTALHYNFFLDEMVVIYNDYKVKTLEKRGLKPRLIPVEELLAPR